MLKGRVRCKAQVLAEKASRKAGLRLSWVGAGGEAEDPAAQDGKCALRTAGTCKLDHVVRGVKSASPPAAPALYGPVHVAVPVEGQEAHGAVLLQGRSVHKVALRA